VQILCTFAVSVRRTQWKDKKASRVVCEHLRRRVDSPKKLLNIVVVERQWWIVQRESKVDRCKM
jgi:hypothetical protein